MGKTLLAVLAAAAQLSFASIASSSDVIRFQSRKASDAAGYHRIAIDRDLLKKVLVKATLSMRLPSGASYPVVYDRTLTHESGNETWVGHFRDFGTDYRVIITHGEAATFGQMLTPEGWFSIESLRGDTWLIDTRSANLKTAFYFASDALPPPHKAHLTNAAPAHAEAPLKVMPTPQTTVDLMVLYTPGMVTRYGSTAAVSTRIDNLVAVANTGYTDSEVAITLRVVYRTQVAYPDTGSNNTALTELTNSSHAAFASVSSWRTTYGADLVTLIRPYHRDTHNGCGLAWIGGYQQSSIVDDAPYGFSLVGDGSDTGGSGYYCLTATLAHELGHNMGSMHDRATVISQHGSLVYGAYSYSFGYGSAGVFGTIMSYINPRITKFSNPALSTCAGLPCGVSEADAGNSANNALSLNNTRQAVANFRGTMLPASALNRRDLSGDSRSDILWRNNPTGNVWLYQMDGSTVISTAFIGGNSGWSVVGTNDFNADTRSDVLWRHDATGQAWLHIMNGGVTVSTHFIGGNSDWSVVASGDFNGDGIADVLWRHSPTGQVWLHVMSGGITLSTHFVGGNLEWTPLHASDLSGDGKSDILWRHNATAQVWLHVMNGGVTVSTHYIGGNLQWNAVATGDFNGDGKADVLWRHNGTANVWLHLMNGGVTMSTHFIGGNAEWSVAGTGDFNGDGKSDLLWLNNPSSIVWMYLMNVTTPTSTTALGGGASWSAL